MSNRKTKRIGVRLSESVYDQLRAEADKYDLGVSTYARKLLSFGEFSLQSAAKQGRTSVFTGEWAQECMKKRQKPEL